MKHKIIFKSFDDLSNPAAVFEVPILTTEESPAMPPAGGPESAVAPEAASPSPSPVRERKPVCPAEAENWSG